MPWWLVLLLVGLAFVAGAGVAMMVLRQRRQQRRPGPGRDRKRSTAYESVYPLPIPVFRSLVAHLAQQKAATRPGQFTAQDGEDVLLAELFGYKTDGFFIEIGAYDGLYLSNSYFFEQLGWRGLLVEPLPEKAAACRRNRPGSIVIEAALGRQPGTATLTEVLDGGAREDVLSYIGGNEQIAGKLARLNTQTRSYQVTVKSFPQVMAEAGHRPGMAIDFISIDCEGMDLEILQTIDLDQWQPRIFVLESAGEAATAYLQQHGYAPMLRIRANILYSRQPADQATLSVRGYWHALGVTTAG